MPDDGSPATRAIERNGTCFDEECGKKVAHQPQSRKHFRTFFYAFRSLVRTGLGGWHRGSPVFHDGDCRPGRRSAANPDGAQSDSAARTWGHLKDGPFLYRGLAVYSGLRRNVSRCRYP